MNGAIRLILTVFSASTVYAFLRYIVFGDVEVAHLPLFILNKATALSGFFLLIISSVISMLKNRDFHWLNSCYQGKDIIGKGSFLLIIAHVFISLIIMSPAYFEKFFAESDRLNLKGELSMLMGVAGLIFLWRINRYFTYSAFDRVEKRSRPLHRQLISWGIVVSSLHVIIMGYDSWFEPGKWHGYFPPITLVALVGFILWIVTIIIAGNRRKIN